MSKAPACTPLPQRMVEKPWGRTMLPPPFSAPPGMAVGEIWFEPPARLDSLLVKYIFTAQALSVQVHPSDEQTLAAGLGRQGKAECWLVVAAEPGAQLGIGFRSDVDGAAMRAAALDGSIEQLLEWYPVSAGDFFYIPPGTVHAIGAGVSLIEVQQNSEITYRLYDYGRPRALHLDEGMAVATGVPHDSTLRCKVPEQGAITLVEGPLFRLDRLDGPPEDAVAARYDGALLAIPMSGELGVTGTVITPGECAMIESIADLEIAAGSRCLIAQPC